MEKTDNIVKRGGHESDQHLLLKRAAASELVSEGFQATIESSISDDCKADVLGIHNGRRPIVVECETLLELQGKLVNTFRKAHLRYDHVEAILCIPKFAEIAEIWCVSDAGEVVKYIRRRWDDGRK